MVLTLPGSGASLFGQTTWPKKVVSCTKNSHLEGFVLRTSSMKLTVNSLYGRRMTETMQLKALGAFAKPNDNTHHLNNPHCVVNAVFFLSLSSMGICQ
eukprot:2722687-Rhodomonas_salina.4